MCLEHVNFFIQHQQVKQQRDERRQKFAVSDGQKCFSEAKNDRFLQLEQISEKLAHDPTGSSLSSKEKKVLHRLDREPEAEPEPEQSAQPQPPLEAEAEAEAGPSPRTNGHFCCTCDCHSVGKSTSESATQTLSTGPITMSDIYYDNQ